MTKNDDHASPLTLRVRAHREHVRLLNASRPARLRQRRGEPLTQWDHELLNELRAFRARYHLQGDDHDHHEEAGGRARN